MPWTWRSQLARRVAAGGRGTVVSAPRGGTNRRRSSGFRGLEQQGKLGKVPWPSSPSPSRRPSVAERLRAPSLARCADDPFRCGVQIGGWNCRFGQMPLCSSLADGEARFLADGWMKGKPCRGGSGACVLRVAAESDSLGWATEQVASLVLSGQSGSRTSMTLAGLFLRPGDVRTNDWEACLFYLNPAKMSHWFTSRNCCYMVVRCLNIPGSHFRARS